jgi:PTS system nitrogen regulatory IIA component
MDLKIKDVADLLNVSETTIRRWLVDGKIPAYRLNQQYRFNRLEIEDWVMNQRLGQASISSAHAHAESEEDEKTSDSPSASRGSKQFSLYRAIHKGGVFYNVPGANKEEVIRTTMKQVAPELNVDADVISDLLMDRENLQPTALNNGIAIPHTRDFLLNAPFDVLAVVFPEHPINYGALDNKPVHTLFFLFASSDKRHLHLLAKIAHLSSQPKTLQFLQTKPSKEQLLEFIKQWESEIS